MGVGGVGGIGVTDNRVGRPFGVFGCSLVSLLVAACSSLLVVVVVC